MRYFAKAESHNILWVGSKMTCTEEGVIFKEIKEMPSFHINRNAQSVKEQNIHCQVYKFYEYI